MPNPPEESITNMVRSGLERACCDFTARVEPLGFRRTLNMFWTRRRSLAVEFIHFHRNGSTYGSSRTASVGFRLHFGIRVLNDDFVTVALNGPHSDAGTLRSGRYHLRFNAETGSSYDRCVDDLERFVVEQGEPWFQKWSSADALLHPDSPLSLKEGAFLRASLAGMASAEHIAASLKLLGIKDQ